MKTFLNKHRITRVSFSHFSILLDFMSMTVQGLHVVFFLNCVELLKSIVRGTTY